MPANSDANVVVGAPSPIAGWSNVMESKPKKSVVRYLASGVFVVIAGLTTTGFVLTRQASHDQEERLLRERTGEVAVHGRFDHFENFGRDLAFTGHVGPENCGAPLVADDGRVVGVARGPMQDRPNQDVASPAWQVVRMRPALSGEKKNEEQ